MANRTFDVAAHLAKNNVSRSVRVSLGEHKFQLSGQPRIENGKATDAELAILCRVQPVNIKVVEPKAETETLAILTPTTVMSADQLADMVLARHAALYIKTEDSPKPGKEARQGRNRLDVPAPTNGAPASA